MGKNLKPCIPFLHQGSRSESAGEQRFPVPGFGIRAIPDLEKEKGNMSNVSAKGNTPQAQMTLWPPCNSNNRTRPPLSSTKLSLSQTPSSHLLRNSRIGHQPYHGLQRDNPHKESPGVPAPKASLAKNGVFLS